jgi:hypothetical protein
MMLPAPTDALTAGAHALVVAAFGLVLGRLVIDVLLPGRELDAIDRWGLAVVGLAAFALALMLLHIVTRGRVLGDPGVTRALTAAAFVGLGLRSLAVRRHLGGRVLRTDGPLMIAAAGVAVVVWGSPVARLLPLDMQGDTILHTGWASQLLNGEATPAAAITGEIPNFYPWLFHALLALVARVTPGGRAYHALAPVHLLLVCGSALALFALGRALGGRSVTGFAAAVMAGVAGGVGFVMLRGLDVVMDPRADGLRYLGDLLYKRSYNIAFYGLAPPFPRELAWVLLTGALTLLVIGLRAGRTRLLVSAGVALGMAGLSGAEAFMVGSAAVVGLAVLPGMHARLRFTATVLGSAFAVYSLWLIPQAVTYLRLDGYVNLTLVGPVTLPAHAVAVSLGLVTPVALVGVIASVRRVRSDAGARVLLALLSASALTLLVAGGLPALAGEAFRSLGRAHRYWPLLSFALALYASLGATWLVDRVSARRIPAWTAWTALVVAVVPSSLVASLALPREASNPRYAVAEAIGGGSDMLLNLIAPTSTGACHAAVPQELDGAVWSYSGYRLVAYTTEDRPTNPARIRWAGIYERITPSARRSADNRLLTEGPASFATWEATARRYGVDVVVVQNAFVDRSPFRELGGVPARDRPYTIYRLTGCGE